MFIVSLTYKVPLERIEAHIEGHMAWLEDAYARGLLIASGRKVPRSGGVLLSHAERPALEACLATDPFQSHDLADYEIIECAITLTAPGFEALKG
ncbi:GTP cyclohydrolase [Salinicola endophyticus]|uniref:GTP cyclohydrolase n=1 Tax=Salinicola endophyticus TaxID=1949083 RepID=A0ABY8FHE2_9GAMM|nr:YciI family protein [Salinicola endophyticus]WFF42226.1 GTP cyclohydrolase [Salinicola endophyticus]